MAMVHTDIIMAVHVHPTVAEGAAMVSVLRWSSSS